MGILDTNHSSCCGIVKILPKIPIDDCFYLPRCVNHFFSFHAQVVNKGSPADPHRVLDGVTMLSRLWRIMEPCDSSGHCMLDAENVPAGGILWERMIYDWCPPLTRAVPGLGRVGDQEGNSGAVRRQSTPGPGMSRKWLGWGGFSCSVILSGRGQQCAWRKRTQERTGR